MIMNDAMRKRASTEEKRATVYYTASFKCMRAEAQAQETFRQARMTRFSIV
jgi:hypothetical protein